MDPVNRRGSAAAGGRSRLLYVLAISSVIFVVELVAGYLTNSLALLADAAHVFTDVTGVVLALTAIWFAARPASDRRSYGHYRVEILAAVANAALLLGIAAAVVVEAIRRVQQEPQIQTGPMLVVASVGLLANLLSAALLRDSAEKSLNMRGAYLEVLADALGSAAVLVAGGIIALTGFRAADAIASAFIGVLIVPRTWGLMRDALDILLEATPKGVDIAHVRQHIVETPGVNGVHDLHVWTITSGMNVISAHVLVRDDCDRAAVLGELSRCLSDDFDIEHSTFQLEGGDHRHRDEAVHA